MRLKYLIFAFALTTFLLTSCAQIYPIQRYNGEYFFFSSYKYGDHHFLYSVEYYESGAVKSETAEFDRKISPITEQGFKFGESIIAGARSEL